MAIEAAVGNFHRWEDRVNVMAPTLVPVDRQGIDKRAIDDLIKVKTPSHATKHVAEYRTAA